MASKIEYSDRAQQNLILIKDHIAQDDPVAADDVVTRIATVISHLADFPELGTAWRNTETRVLVVPNLPYRVHYQIAGDTVQIITIVHTSRRFPMID